MMNDPGVPPVGEEAGRLLTRGRQYGRSGALAQAESCFKRVLFQSEAERSSGWFSAMHYLGTTYGSCGRAFEAWVCGRAASDWARQRELDYSLARTLATAAASAAMCEDSSGTAATLSELRGVLGRLGDGAPPWALQDYHESSVKWALLEEDLVGAQMHLSRMAREVRRAGNAGAREDHVLCVLLGSVHLLAGLPVQAGRALMRAPSIPGSNTCAKCSLDVAWLRVLKAQENWAQAERLARRIARRLRDTIGEATFSYLRVEIGRELGEFWSERAHDSPEAAFVRDMLAQCVLERIGQVDAWAVEFSELDFEGMPQSDSVIRARTRFERGQQAALERVADLLVRRPGAKRVLMGEADGLAHVCGWCTRLRSATSGAWLPLGQYVPRDGSLGVTHGICGSCRDRVMQRT